MCGGVWGGEVCGVWCGVMCGVVCGMVCGVWFGVVCGVVWCVVLWRVNCVVKMCCNCVTLVYLNSISTLFLQGPNSYLRYYIQDSNGLFDVVGDGVVVVNGSLDYESNITFTFVVRTYTKSSNVYRVLIYVYFWDVFIAYFY